MVVEDCLQESIRQGNCWFLQKHLQFHHKQSSLLTELWSWNQDWIVLVSVSVIHCPGTALGVGSGHPWHSTKASMVPVLRSDVNYTSSDIIFSGNKRSWSFVPSSSHEDPWSGMVLIWWLCVWDKVVVKEVLKW